MTKVALKIKIFFFFPTTYLHHKLSGRIQIQNLLTEFSAGVLLEELCLEFFSSCEQKEINKFIFVVHLMCMNFVNSNKFAVSEVWVRKVFLFLAFLPRWKSYQEILENYSPPP